MPPPDDDSSTAKALAGRERDSQEFPVPKRLKLDLHKGSENCAPASNESQQIAKADLLFWVRPTGYLAQLKVTGLLDDEIQTELFQTGLMSKTATHCTGREGIRSS